MTNQIQTIEIYRNGELEQPSIASRAGNMLASAAIHALSATYEASKRVLGDMSTSIALDIVDAQNGTNLRHAYYEQKRTARVAAIASEYGITARDSVGRYV